MSNLIEMNCIACRGGDPPASEEEREVYFPQIPDWKVVMEADSERITRVFSFKKYLYGLEFANAVGQLAHEQHHHPAILVEWRKITITWWTHVIDGLHVNDFISAAKTDQIYTKDFSSQK